MILFLTYHKVLRGPESKPELYTVQAGQLQRHLELLAKKGLRSLPVRELIGGEAARATPDRASRGPANASKPDRESCAPAAEPVSFLLTFDDGTVDHYEIVLPLL